MAQTWILRHVLVMICLGCAASTSSDHSDPDPDMLQSEVTFDLSDIWGLEEAEPVDLVQKEVTFDLPEFLKETVSSHSGPDISQKEVTDELAMDLPSRVPAGFSPRGFGRPQPSVAFPPGRPSPDNIEAICLDSTGRPRYPPGSLPQSGFSHLSRQADALHRAEAWYSQQCCQGNWQGDLGRTLCCARQAWEKAMDEFCNDEFSIKTRHHHCCKIQGESRKACFANIAPNPTYERTTNYYGPELMPRGATFTFSSNCTRSSKRESVLVGPRSLRSQESDRVVDINFPPGRPTASNIRMVCKTRKLRPRYNPGCLPRRGYGWLARQSKAINRLEKGLKRCCKGKKDVLACADEKWREAMNRFCQDEHGVKTKHYECCTRPKGDERLSCFSSKAPFPDYEFGRSQQETFPIDLHLGLVCDTHKILKKQKVEMPVDSIVKSCCHLVPEEKNACLQDMLDNLHKKGCSETQSPISLACCTANSPKCLTDLLLMAIQEAVKTPSFKRKRCPLTY